MEFKVMDLIKYYFKHIILNIILILTVFMSGLFYIFYIHENEYVSSTSVMLGVCVHECEEDEHLNVNFNKMVIYDYMELLKSNLVINNAIKLSELDYTTNEVRNMLDVSYEEDTEYIKIKIISKNQKHSSKLSYNLYKSLINEVERIFDIDNIHLVDTDEVGYLNTSNKKLIIIDTLIAIIISIIVMIIKFLFFSNIKKDEKKIYKKTKKD